jgi:DNA-damage-inducible protein D
MSDIEQNPERRIALFQRKEVRRTIHNNEWWFVITDVVAALTDSANPQGYLKDIRRRDLAFAEALKGGGKLPPPLGCRSTRRADANCCSAGTRKGSSV